MGRELAGTKVKCICGHDTHLDEYGLIPAHFPKGKQKRSTQKLTAQSMCKYSGTLAITENMICEK